MRVLNAAALAALLTLAVGCGGASDGGPADAGAASTADAPDRGAGAAPAAASVWVLEGEWTDQDGRAVRLSDLVGRPRVVVMAYTHCAHACPALVARMKAVESAFLDQPPEAQPGFLLVSIDPERDTPDRLAEFARTMELDPARWTLLNGSDGQILELAVLLGVKYRPTGTGDFAHSNLLTVIDAEGAPLVQVEGLSGGVERAVDALRGVLPMAAGT